MIKSKRMLAAGFAAALGVAGFGLGGSALTASAGAAGGVCEGIDIAALGSGAASDGSAAVTEGTDATAAPEGTEAPAAEGTAAAAEGSAAPTEGGTNVALLFDVTGRGDKSFNDAAAAGLDQATTEFGINGTESTPSGEGDRAERLSAAVADGNSLVIAVGFLWGQAVTDGAANAPDTHFGIVDYVVDLPNVSSLVFAEEQGSFLVGAAAALQSKTGTIGFIGGVPNELIKKFEAGYVAGAKCVNPDINVLVEYVNDDPSIGFNDPDTGNALGKAMYEAGADVVYPAAGASGAGALTAASEAGDPGDVWFIGVDSDWYGFSDPSLQPYILTSMLKRVDVATFETIASEVGGSFAAGVRVFDLAVDGVGYATSGGFVDAYVPVLDGLKALIVDGTIAVPTVPEEG